MQSLYTGMSSETRGERPWRVFEEQVRGLPPTTDVAVPKHISLPPHFAESPFSKDKGETRAFRENRAQNSLHVREYADRYTVHVDRYNPHHHPVRHLVFDAPREAVKSLVGFLGIGVAAWRAVKRFR
jgi:hypothetical protein